VVLDRLFTLSCTTCGTRCVRKQELMVQDPRLFLMVRVYRSMCPCNRRALVALAGITAELSNDQAASTDMRRASFCGSGQAIHAQLHYVWHPLCTEAGIDGPGSEIVLDGACLSTRERWRARRRTCFAKLPASELVRVCEPSNSSPSFDCRRLFVLRHHHSRECVSSGQIMHQSQSTQPKRVGAVGVLWAPHGTRCWHVKLVVLEYSWF
jgi:hypothetical protein